ncbi:hypothetical protein [Novosphingobium sp.]|uniref:hypothetical protein n=1 Tax=Novosphingobium sp. TaxID=1874826 RepID=UPI0035B2EE07
MAVMVRKEWLIAGVLAAGLAVLLAWAWQDGGERPLREISQSVTIPPVTTSGANR